MLVGIASLLANTTFLVCCSMDRYKGYAQWQYPEIHQWMLWIDLLVLLCVPWQSPPKTERDEWTFGLCAILCVFDAMTWKLTSSTAFAGYAGVISGVLVLFLLLARVCCMVVLLGRIIWMIIFSQVGRIIWMIIFSQVGSVRVGCTQK
jgi:hypothetical protein